MATERGRISKFGWSAHNSFGRIQWAGKPVLPSWPSRPRGASKAPRPGAPELEDTRGVLLVMAPMRRPICVVEWRRGGAQLEVSRSWPCRRLALLLVVSGTPPPARAAPRDCFLEQPRDLGDGLFAEAMAPASGAQRLASPSRHETRESGDEMECDVESRQGGDAARRPVVPCLEDRGCKGRAGAEEVSWYPSACRGPAPVRGPFSQRVEQRGLEHAGAVSESGRPKSSAEFRRSELGVGPEPLAGPCASLTPALRGDLGMSGDRRPPVLAGSVLGAWGSPPTGGDAACKCTLRHELVAVCLVAIWRRRWWPRVSWAPRGCRTLVWAA